MITAVHEQTGTSEPAAPRTKYEIQGRFKTGLTNMGVVHVARDALKRETDFRFSIVLRGLARG